jgi:hypothetical protein
MGQQEMCRFQKQNWFDLWTNMSLNVIENKLGSLLKNTIFWDGMPYSLIHTYETAWHHISEDYNFQSPT